MAFCSRGARTPECAPPPLTGDGTSVCATTRLRPAREGRAPNGAGRFPVGEPEPAELVVWHEFLDQRKELSLLKPDVCVKQFSRRSQCLSIDDAGRDGDLELASEPLELHVLDACLAEGSRLRLDVPEQKREELFFLIAKVDTLFVPEEHREFPRRHEPSRSISIRGSTAQPQCMHQSIVMVARERDQGGVALHSTTLGCSAGQILGGDDPILVDTGAANPEIMHRLGMEGWISKEQVLEAQLAKYDLEPKDVRWILHTHLHIDHAGQDDHFPHSTTVVINRRELEFSVSGLMGEQYPAEYVKHLVDRLHAPGALRLLDLELSGPEEIIPGVRCEHAGGHTEGSMNILVEGTRGRPASAET